MFYQLFRQLKIYYYQLERFLYFFWKHFTLKKFCNFLLVNFEFWFKKTRLRGKAFVLFIEPANLCNLHCPLCPTGQGNQGRIKGKMTLEFFKKIIDQLGDYLFFCTLHIWGEPLLCENIFEMIKYAQSKNIGTVISSNLNLLNQEKAKKLVDSGLEHLIISLDGASQETYSKYRRGGNFNKVIENIKLLVEEKNRQKTKLPFLEWQYIIMKHNQKELEKASELAKKLGVDKFKSYTEFKVDLNYFKGYYSQKEAFNWLPEENMKALEKINFRKPYIFNKPCFYLWRVASIHHDGGVSPCCYLDDQKTDFGNLNQESFFNIWNNVKFQSARNLFRKKPKADLMAQAVCLGCRQFKKR